MKIDISKDVELGGSLEFPNPKELELTEDNWAFSIEEERIKAAIWILVTNDTPRQVQYLLGGTFRKPLIIEKEWLPGSMIGIKHGANNITFVLCSNEDALRAVIGSEVYFRAKAGLKEHLLNIKLSEEHIPKSYKYKVFSGHSSKYDQVFWPELISRRFSFLNNNAGVH